MLTYDTFIASKRRTYLATGIDLNVNQLSFKLFEFQRDVVAWALRKGKACAFLGTGLGKTAVQLEWAKHVVRYTNGKVLILAPLAVSAQTVEEGKKFDVQVTRCRSAGDVRDGVNITNYELLDKFDLSVFAGIVLDESSILKSFTSKTRNQIIKAFGNTPYRLACTATPAPNDHMELGNHAEFVGAMSRTEMLSMFFVHDGGDTSVWRLKKHAQADFWKWVASWAVMMTKPSDLGYVITGYDLPALDVKQVTVDDLDAITRLEEFKASRRNKNSMAGLSLEVARDLRRISLSKRVQAAAAIVAQEPDQQWMVWCDLNDESTALVQSIPGAVEVVGSDSPEDKAQAFADFASGKIRVLVSKPSIAGFGMNWQHCCRTVFVGLSYSFEAYYQAVRRFWRFGQVNPVTAYVVTSAAEANVVEVIQQKERLFAEMLSGMVSATQEITKENVRRTGRVEDQYQEDSARGKGWMMLLGDACTRLKELPNESVGFSIFSPPFASLYTYSASDRDLGNCTSQAEFFDHFKFIVKELHRVLKSGRNISVHCMLLPTSKQSNGYIGIRDFRGEVIRLFEACGFIFHSEVAIWKNPVTAMQRTKALGLLHKQIRKDSAMSRNGINDYLVTFRKPGENTAPISHTHETFPVSMWQQFASPVWADVNPSDTLQYRSARENDDERHICPLQLSVVQRAIYLWSAPKDLVLSPFAGIGSEGWQAVSMGRRFIGIELKQSYWAAAVKNLQLREVELEAKGPDLSCPIFQVFQGKEAYGKAKEEAQVLSLVEEEQQCG